MHQSFWGRPLLASVETSCKNDRKRCSTLLRGRGRCLRDQHRDEALCVVLAIFGKFANTKQARVKNLCVD